MRYFKTPYTPVNLKTQYKAHVKKLHPDKGGNENEFLEMQSEYNLILEKKNNLPALRKKKRVIKKRGLQIVNNYYVLDINDAIELLHKLF